MATVSRISTPVKGLALVHPDEVGVGGTDEVRRRRSRGIGKRRPAPLAPPQDALDPELTHQASDALLADANAVRLTQLGVHARRGAEDL